MAAVHRKGWIQGHALGGQAACCDGCAARAVRVAGQTARKAVARFGLRFCRIIRAMAIEHHAFSGSGRNLIAAAMVRTTNRARTTDWVTRKGGSDPLGAMACRAGTFMNS